MVRSDQHALLPYGFCFTHVSAMTTRTPKQKRSSGVLQKAIEVKYLDYTSVSGSLGNGPVNWSLWYVPRLTRGTESYSRVGNQIFAKSLHLRAYFLRNSSGATVQRIHVGVLKTREPEGVSATASTVYSNTALFDSFLVPEQSNTVALWQKNFELEAGKSSSAYIDVKIPLGFVIKYIANSGLAADCQQNCIDLVMWSDQTTNQPTVQIGEFRLTYTD